MKGIPKKNKERTTKITVGSDEFCSNCMEWREYDEEGKCKICEKLIKTTTRRARRTDYDEYGIDSVFDEGENEIDDSY
ncbi:MAG: hypothetical protein JSW60_05775 [Thermoplasmatales archaeon]|nr:MAG: hypothetical protein JSW60_05775 [Thermoplasmatales archaeon]